jgi:hypothetical protein
MDSPWARHDPANEYDMVVGIDWTAAVAMVGEVNCMPPSFFCMHNH